jgi:hypothetical protein
MFGKYTITAYLQLMQVIHSGLHASCKMSFNNEIRHVSVTDSFISIELWQNKCFYKGN